MAKPRYKSKLKVLGAHHGRSEEEEGRQEKGGSVYLDTSFVVSLYSIDANSSEASRILRNLQSSAQILLSTFSVLEVVNALQLRVFRKQDSSAEARLAVQAFESDLQTGRFQIRLLPELIFQRASELSLRTTAQLGTRTSDLLHVTCALELGADGLYTFDKQQKKLAESVKLKVSP